MLKLIGLTATVVGGFGIGRTTFNVRVRIAILTTVLAAIAQASMKLTLPHDAIEQFAQSQLDTALGRTLLIGVAVVETAGVLVLVALMPWTNISTRAWATLYLLGAAILAAATYYFPFDVEIFNGEVIGPKHPDYEWGLLVCLPLGALGYLVGWLRRRYRARSDRTSDLVDEHH